MNKKYLKMLDKMASTGPPEWHVYMLRCGDGSLYTGIAKNIRARLLQHEKGKGAAYTKTHLPLTLIYQEGPFARSEALVREAQIKRLSRPSKEKLVKVS